MHYQSPTFLITPPENCDLPDSEGCEGPSSLGPQLHPGEEGRSLSPTKRSELDRPNSGWDKIFSKPLQRSRSAGSRSDVKTNGLYGTTRRKVSVQKTQLSADDASVEELTEEERIKKNKEKKSLFDVKEVLSFFHRKSTHELSGMEISTNLSQNMEEKFGGSQGNLSSPDNLAPGSSKHKKHGLYHHHEGKSSSRQSSFPSQEQIKRWESNLDHLLADRYGLALFNAFLKTEYSDENLEFWIACEAYKSFSGHKKLYKEAQKIYSQHLSVQAPREVNLDSKTRLQTISSLGTPSKMTFDCAQKRIFALMEKDSYPRFLRSDLYQLVQRGPAGPGSPGHRNSCVDDLA